MAFGRLDLENPSLERIVGNLSHPEENLTNTYAYHAVRNFSTAKDILEDESVKSRKRKNIDTRDSKKGQIFYVEDLLLMFRGETDQEINMIEYAEENKDELKDHITEESENFIDNHLEIFEILNSPTLEDQGVYGPLRDYCVSVGDDISYHVSSRVSYSGLAFEFTLPDEAILNPGIEGNVPGEIPLDYATAIYYSDHLEEEQIRELENHDSTEKHGLETFPVSHYFED